jgi:hypothetical protein
VLRGKKLPYELGSGNKAKRVINVSLPSYSRRQSASIFSFMPGATAAFGVYCPGLLTALTLYPPLFYVVTRLAFRQGLLTNGTAIISFALAGLVHAADVSHNVFKAW